MPKKNIRILSAVAGIALIVAGIVAYFSFRGADVYRAVPDSAMAVVAADDWAQLSDKLNTTLPGMAFRKTAVATRLFDELNSARSLVAAEPLVVQRLYSDKTVASLHLTSADNYDFLFVTELSTTERNALFQNVVRTAKAQQVKTRTFKGVELLDITWADGHALTLAATRGLLLCSATGFLVESGLSALGGDHSLAQDKSFCSLRGKAVGVRLYVHWANVGSLLPVLLQSAAVPLFSDLEKSGYWSVYTLSFTQSAIHMEGSIDLKGKTAETAAQPAQFRKALAYIPRNTAVADIMALDSTKLAQQDLTASFFRRWADGFCAFLTIEPLADAFEEQHLFIIGMNDKKEARASLVNMLGAEGSAIAPVDSFRGEGIYRLKSGRLLNQFFGDNFCTLDAAYFILWDKAAVFANNKDVMKLALENIVQRNTLAVRPQKLQGLAGNRMLYVNLHRSQVLLPAVLRQQTSALEFLAEFASITATAAPEGKRVRSAITFLMGNEQRETGGVVWRTETGSFLVGKPHKVLRTDSAATNEWLVQDSAGVVYLLSASGDIRFKRSVEGFCLGNVYGVDYYHNGSFQYLMTTTRRIYLMDKEGNDVASFPIRLSSEATAGISLRVSPSGAVHYLIPCGEGKIYGYELSGRPLSGWSPNKIAGSVETPVFLFTAQTKNYAAIYTSSGRLLLCDERGNKQWSTPDEDSLMHPQLLVLKNDFLFLFTRNNKLITVSSDGKMMETPLLDSVVAFTAFTVSDSSFRYVFASENGDIRMYDRHNNFVASTALKLSAVSDLFSLHLSGATWIVAKDSAAGNVFVLNTALKVVRQFGGVAANQSVVDDLWGRGEPVLLGITNDGQVNSMR